MVDDSQGRRAKRRPRSLLATGRALAAGLLVFGIVAAVLTSAGSFRSSPEAPQGADASRPPEHLRPLADSMGAWLDATPKQRAEYVAWLLETGLEVRRSAVLHAIDRDAEARAQQSGAQLAVIFLFFAAAALLLFGGQQAARDLAGWLFERTAEAPAQPSSCADASA